MKYCKNILLLFLSLSSFCSCDPREHFDPPLYLSFIIQNDTDEAFYLDQFDTWLKSESGWDGDVPIGPYESLILDTRHSECAFYKTIFDDVWGGGFVSPTIYISKILPGEESPSVIRCYEFSDRSSEDSFFNEAAWERRDWPDPEDDYYHHYEWTFHLSQVLEP